MADRKECLFCSIADRRIPAHVVYEDAHAFAFLDIHPRSPGHTVVVPKVHANDLLDIPESEIGPLFSAVRKTATAVKAATHADALTIGINNGRVSGQEVDHLHIHIIPRFAGDGGGSIQSLAHGGFSGSLSEMVEKIQSTIHK